MANKKTQYKKEMFPCFCEPRLAELCRIFTKEIGCFHSSVGSVSEFLRRSAKKELLRIKPYLKNTEKNVDWNEAY
jgi:hypothetical protein